MKEWMAKKVATWVFKRVIVKCAERILGDVEVEEEEKNIFEKVIDLWKNKHDL